MPRKRKGPQVYRRSDSPYYTMAFYDHGGKRWRISSGSTTEAGAWRELNQLISAGGVDLSGGTGSRMSHEGRSQRIEVADKGRRERTRALLRLGRDSTAPLDSSPWFKRIQDIYPSSILDPLLGPEALALHLGVSVDEVFHMAEHLLIPGYRAGDDWRFDVREVRGALRVIGSVTFPKSFAPEEEIPPEEADGTPMPDDE